jgi:hypothetical protein
MLGSILENVIRGVHGSILKGHRQVSCEFTLERIVKQTERVIECNLQNPSEHTRECTGERTQMCSWEACTQSVLGSALRAYFGAYSQAGWQSRLVESGASKGACAGVYFRWYFEVYL